MDQSAFVFEAPLWRYSGPAAWYFITLPVDVAAQIRPHAAKVGFGSVRVQACIGSTRWKTSVFPDKASGSYVLPIKSDVRQRESLAEGATTVVFLEL